MFTGISLHSNIVIQGCRLVLALKRLFSLSKDFAGKQAGIKALSARHLQVSEFGFYFFVQLCFYADIRKP